MAAGAVTLVLTVPVTAGPVTLAVAAVRGARCVPPAGPVVVRLVARREHR